MYRIRSRSSLRETLRSDQRFIRRTISIKEAVATEKPKTDWLKVKLDYVNSTKTYDQLGEEYGINPATIRKRGSIEDWSEQRHEIAQSITDAVGADLKAERIKRLFKTNNRDYHLSSKLKVKIEKKLNDDDEDELSASDLRSLAGAHESAQKVSRLSIGLSTDIISGTVNPETGKELSHEQLMAEALALGLPTKLFE